MRRGDRNYFVSWCKILLKIRAFEDIMKFQRSISIAVLKKKVLEKNEINENIYIYIEKNSNSNSNSKLNKSQLFKMYNIDNIDFSSKNIIIPL